jgi:CubicO group peptidase (beta-lactamase class C family)
MKLTDVVRAFGPAGGADAPPSRYWRSAPRRISPAFDASGGGKLRTTFNVVLGFGLAVGVALFPVAISSHGAPIGQPNVDAIFAKYSSTTPGCAVGVATDGKPMLAKGYGMADLEHDVRIAPDTVFEAGSVSKQFTAAAVMLLARDGKLSLDDPVRKYIPELPEYPAPLTVRHMLTHTSGLRDWGSVAGIAGWPRTTRVYTHAHVLEIVGRQQALNFTPGTRWSYSNTGFNLAAIIVERVSGRSFQAFTHDRLFQPLGMAHTSWRDDHTRIVKGRAVAYTERKGFRITMPFEDVFGNGGLLTTVGDLLKWNEHYDAPPEGDASLVAEQQTPGRFNDGRAHRYGLGLYIGTHNGVREVYHSGSTAGYQAFLTRFPDQHVSVAVLCNVASATATQYARAVADAYLGERVKASETKATHTLTSDELERFAGVWKSDATGMTVTIGRDKEGLFLSRTVRLPALSPTRLTTSDGDQQIELDARGLRRTDASGTVEEFSRAQPARYSDEQMAQLAGTYVSDDAETTLKAAVENHALVLKRRPDTTIALTPVYADAFAADNGLGTVVFRRDSNGRATGLSVMQDRVWDMPFGKLEVRSQK